MQPDPHAITFRPGDALTAERVECRKIIGCVLMQLKQFDNNEVVYSAENTEAFLKCLTT